MSKETGGPAFPVLNDAHHMIVNMDAGARLAEGMTLRDYLAAKAMQALLSKPIDTGADALAIPKVSYQVADAMLLERSK